MKEKKQTIIDVLNMGTKVNETTSHRFIGDKEHNSQITRVKNEFGVYEYPRGDEQELLKVQKKWDRYFSTMEKWQDPRGARAYNQVNETQKQLAKLKGNGTLCSIIAKAYSLSLEVSKPIQKYLFENIMNYYKTHGFFDELNQAKKDGITPDFYVASIIPKAWITEQILSSGYYWLDELIFKLSANIEIGAEVVVPSKDGSMLNGKVIGYTYKGENVRKRGYSYSGYEHYGDIVLWYNILFEGSTRHVIYRKNDVKEKVLMSA